MNYILELTDDDGNACRIKLSLPFFKKDTQITNSTWQTLNTGLIKYNSGGCVSKRPGWWEKIDLRLFRGKEYGVKLFQFTDKYAIVNDSGEGYIYPPWCVKFKPGKITFALIE